jgi:hypothetical protein
MGEGNENLVHASCETSIRLPSPWYFSSGANVKSHHSGVKSQTVALYLCVVFLVLRFFFVKNLFNVVLKFSRVFKTLLTIPVVPVVYRYDSISCSTFSEFLGLDFYVLISSEPSFVLHSYLMVLLHKPISRFCNSF